MKGRRASILLAIAALGATISAAPAHAQQVHDVFARGCGDDDGVDRCDDDVQARMRAQYGIAAATDLLDADVTARRAMFVDGYGHDIAAVVFRREPGRMPLVEVFIPAPAEADQPNILRAMVDDATWSEVLARSAHFDQRLAREVPTANGAGESGLASMCLHAWFVVVDAVDAPRVSPTIMAGTGTIDEERDPTLPVDPPMVEGAIRSDAEGACANGLAMDYAFALADIAHQSLPQCSTLSMDHFRTRANLLAACRRLKGDRLVAGEAQGEIAELQRLLRLEWGGQSSQELQLQFLFVGYGDERLKLLRKALDGGYLTLTSFVGIDADHAEAHGQIAYTDEDGLPVQVADIKLAMLRQGGEFRIDTVAVTGRRAFDPE